MCVVVRKRGRKEREKGKWAILLILVGEEGGGTGEGITLPKEASTPTRLEVGKRGQKSVRRERLSVGAEKSRYKATMPGGCFTEGRNTPSDLGETVWNTANYTGNVLGIEI